MYKYGYAERLLVYTHQPFGLEGVVVTVRASGRASAKFAEPISL